MKTAFQILFGVVMCVAVAVFLIYSSLPMFWERETQPHVYSITWRSGAVFFLLLAFCQWISILVFHRIKPTIRKPPERTKL
jgi:hypothetical protein